MTFKGIVNVFYNTYNVKMNLFLTISLTLGYLLEADHSTMER